MEFFVDDFFGWFFCGYGERLMRCAVGEGVEVGVEIMG